MRSQLLPISCSFLFLPLRYIETSVPAASVAKNSISTLATDNGEVLYNELHLSDAGLSRKAFEYAYKGYQRLIKKDRLSNPSILSICDLSQSSNKKRFYILDLAENKILLTTYVAHGRGSGAEYARRFSNRGSSHESSLGFFITGNTYLGEHGLSLRLQGLEKGFNDHALRRNIVIHGAEYIGQDFLQQNPYMGRSYGCPAVPQDECEEIIDLIKNGSCLFIYYPTKTYLQRSKILNG